MYVLLQFSYGRFFVESMQSSTMKGERIFWLYKKKLEPPKIILEAP